MSEPGDRVDVFRALTEWLRAHPDVTLTLRYKSGLWWTDIDLPYLQAVDADSAVAFERLWVAIRQHQG